MVEDRYSGHADLRAHESVVAAVEFLLHRRRTTYRHTMYEGGRRMAGANRAFPRIVVGIRVGGLMKPSLMRGGRSVRCDDAPGDSSGSVRIEFTLTVSVAVCRVERVLRSSAQVNLRGPGLAHSRRLRERLNAAWLVSRGTSRSSAQAGYRLFRT